MSTTKLKVCDVKIVTTAVIDQWPKDSWGISGTIVGNLHDIGREIRARVEKLNQLGGKTVDMVDSINHLLDDARKLCDEAGFEAFKKSCCPELGQSRVYELLAIKEGRKTLEEIREAGRLRVAKHRAEKKRARPRCNGKRFRYILAAGTSQQSHRQRTDDGYRPPWCYRSSENR